MTPNRQCHIFLVSTYEFKIKRKFSLYLLRYLPFLMFYIAYGTLEFSFGVISFQPVVSFSFSAYQLTINSLSFILYENVFVFILEKYFHWILNSGLIVYSPPHP